MGIELYPVFNPELTDVQYKREGRRILMRLRELDLLSDVLSVGRLSGFMDNREVEDDHDGDVEDRDAVLGQWEDWFKISDGQKTIRSLISEITRTRSSEEEIADAEPLLDELNMMQECLLMASLKCNHFRLEVGRRFIEMKPSYDDDEDDID